MMEVFSQPEDEALQGKLTTCPRPGCGGRVERFQPELVPIPVGSVMEIHFGNPMTKISVDGVAMGVKTEDLADMTVSDVIWFFNQMTEEDNG